MSNTPDSSHGLSRRGAMARGGQLVAAAGALTVSASASATLGLITPFTIAVPQAELDDLKRRLAATRWPEREPVDDWSQGVPLARLQALVAYWRDRYDWRKCEARINAFPQFRTEIDGLNIHFIHARSKHANALPIILTHGWPGSIVEFYKVIAPLTNPTAFGGKAEDAFHVVAPSLPGYGFSDKPSYTGWGMERIATAWHTLMTRLGYNRYVAQGGDWGARVCLFMGAQRPQGLAALHLNRPLFWPPPGEKQPPSPPRPRWESELGYRIQQSTRPQTLGYGLADSPAGQAAWIYEKFGAWSAGRWNPESAFSMDEMLDNITLYWLTNTGVSSGRLYWESIDALPPGDTFDIPIAYSIFPAERGGPKKWAERIFPNLFYWNEVEAGGHFAAFEQPEIFVRELRNSLRTIRT